MVAIEIESANFCGFPQRMQYASRFRYLSGNRELVPAYNEISDFLFCISLLSGLVV